MESESGGGDGRGMRCEGGGGLGTMNEIHLNETDRHMELYRMKRE